MDKARLIPVIKRILKENGRQYIGTYIFAIICMLLIAGTTAFMAWVMEDVIDESFIKQNANTVWLLCIAIFSAFVIRGFASYGQAVALGIVGNNLVARYQQRLFDHLMALNISYFSDARSAQIAAQISQNVLGIRDTLNLTITSFARDLITLIALIGVMVTKDPVLSFIVFFIAPPIILALRYIAKRLRNATRQSIDFNSQVLGAMQETVQGISIVKAFTMESKLSQKVAALIKNAENRSNKIARLSERTAPITETLSGLVIAGVIAYAASRAIYHQESPGAFFSFTTALLLAYDPVKRLTRMQVNLEKAVVNARMIYDILDQEPLQRDVATSKALTLDKGEIVFDKVSFAYGDDDNVLDNVSFTADAGKTTAIVGPSGAGKSTIISLVPHFYDPTKGRVLIDGTDITDVTKASLRQNIAYVSQQAWLFEGTIMDNIRYGRADATDEEVIEAAKLAYAHEFILAQPEGYDTPVGENGITLSGGQRQRLSIARAIVRNAPILLLDEATSALDNESEAAVQKALDTSMKGRTVIVVAHRLSTIQNADKIIVMEDGHIRQEGSHQELSAIKDGLYARLQGAHLVDAGHLNNSDVTEDKI